MDSTLSMVQNTLQRAMPFGFPDNSVQAITLRSEHGTEFLIVNTPTLSPEDQAQADLIREHISSFVSCPVVLATRQPSGEWFLFGDRPSVFAFWSQALDHARWSQHSLDGKQSNK